MADAPTQPDIALLARQAGLPDLPPEYYPQLADAYANVRRMVNRLPRDWPRGAEPAHVFVPTTFLPGKE
jgi:hypothetical protein